MKYEIQKDLITIIFVYYNIDVFDGNEYMEYFVYNAIDEFSSEQYYFQKFYDEEKANEYANELHEKTQTEDICFFD